MADKKFAEFPPVTQPTEDAILLVLQGGATRRITLAQLLALHEAAGNPHPQYLTPEEALASFARLSDIPAALTGAQIVALLDVALGGTAWRTGGGSSLVQPAAVQSLSAGTPTLSSIRVSWNEPATGTAPFAYTVSYRTSSPPNGAFAVAVSGLTGNSFNVGGLEQATSYDIQVTPSNAAGPGAASTLTGVSTASPVGTGNSVYEDGIYEDGIYA